MRLRCVELIDNLPTTVTFVRVGNDLLIRSIAAEGDSNPFIDNLNIYCCEKYCSLHTTWVLSIVDYILWKVADCTDQLWYPPRLRRLWSTYPEHVRYRRYNCRACMEGYQWGPWCPFLVEGCPHCCIPAIYFPIFHGSRAFTKVSGQNGVEKIQSNQMVDFEIVIADCIVSRAERVSRVRRLW